MQVGFSWGTRSQRAVDSVTLQIWSFIGWGVWRSPTGSLCKLSWTSANSKAYVGKVVKHVFSLGTPNYQNHRSVCSTKSTNALSLPSTKIGWSKHIRVPQSHPLWNPWGSLVKISWAQHSPLCQVHIPGIPGYRLWQLSIMHHCNLTNIIHHHRSVTFAGSSTSPSLEKPCMAWQKHRAPEAITTILCISHGEGTPEW